jgi:hypothetical protein
MQCSTAYQFFCIHYREVRGKSKAGRKVEILCIISYKKRHSVVKSNHTEI